MTSTHTHTIVRFANPYLVCTDCGQRAEGYVHAPGHDEDGENWPCRHAAWPVDLCPSWSPVDGCRCDEFNVGPHRVVEANDA